jgi:hypothetical protein
MNDQIKIAQKMKQIGNIKNQDFYNNSNNRS